MFIFKAFGSHLMNGVGPFPKPTGKCMYFALKWLILRF